MASAELIVTRFFDARRELVWKAWTEPWRTMRWWGPSGFTSPASKIDLRVGGKYHNCMRSPDGKDFWSTGEYREIVEPSRLVMTDSFADEKGNVVPASHYGFSADFPEMLITVTLEDLGDKTMLVLRHSTIDNSELKDRDEMEQGWEEFFDKLDAFLASAARTRITAEPGTADIVMTRTFDAPRKAVFYVMTDRAYVPRWWGPRRLVTTIDKRDFRPGGEWRNVQHDADGNEYAFRGEFREVKPPERFVQTFEYEKMPGHVSVETITFEDKDGKTLVTTRSVFQTVDDRDGMYASGAEEGMTESNDRIDELLTSPGLHDVVCNATGCKEVVAEY